MRRKVWLVIGAVAALWLAGCGGSGGAVDGDGNPEFVSAAGSEESGRNGGGEFDDGAQADGDGGAPSTDEGGKDEAGRELVEADIYKVEGDLIYVLNQYRGLVVIDASEPSGLRIVSRLPFQGVPHEMYVRDGIAFVLLKSTPSDERSRSSENSRVLAIDLADPAEPELIRSFHIDGIIQDTRMVGDVIYLSSFTYRWYYWCGDGDEVGGGDNRVVISSVNVADPADLRKVDEVSFEGNSWAMYVNDHAIYLAATDYAYQTGEYEQANAITYVDISDPDGRIRVRGTARTTGYVQDRFKMDEHNGVLRVVSYTWDWSGRSYLETFDVSDPDNIRRLGRLLVKEGEALHATRFQGDRAYIVTYEIVDPLFVIDLSDPVTPRIMGELIIPGWSTHIEIRGLKLIAVGFDDQDGGRRTKVSLFDVTDPNAPVESASVILGGENEWVYSEANWDWKAFKIFEEQNLILVPTQVYSSNWGTAAHRLHLIDYDGESLAGRGSVDSRGYIRRGIVVGEHLASLSDLEVQLIDYADRDNPRVLSSVRVANYISNVTLCKDRLCDTGGYYYDSALRLRVFNPARDAELPVWESQTLEVADAEQYYWPSGSILQAGDRLYVWSQAGYGYWYGGMEDGAGMVTRDTAPDAQLHTFDIGSIDSPSHLGSSGITFAKESDPGVNYYYSWSYHNFQAASRDGVLAGILTTSREYCVDKDGNVVEDPYGTGGGRQPEGTTPEDGDVAVDGDATIDGDSGDTGGTAVDGDSGETWIDGDTGNTGIDGDSGMWENPCVDWRWEQISELRLVDARNPARAVEGGTVEGLQPLINSGYWYAFGYSYASVLENGGRFYTTDCRPYGSAGSGLPAVACYLAAIDASDPAAPVVSERLNMPGQLVAMSEDGGIIYAVDRQWSPGYDPDDPESYYWRSPYDYYLEILRRDGSRLERVRRIPLEQQYSWWYDDGQQRWTDQEGFEYSYKYTYFFVQDERVWLVQYLYNYGNDYCDASTTRSKMVVELVDGSSGRTIYTRDVQNGSSAFQVQGGGMLIAIDDNPYYWRNFQRDFVYVDPDGDETPVNLETNGYSWVEGAVRIGDRLHLTTGWGGIVTFEL